MMDWDIDFDPSRIPANCFKCWKLQVILQKVNENGGKTKSRHGVCTNPDCFRYTDIRQLRTWERA